jgi:hypothetical protein
MHQVPYSGIWTAGLEVNDRVIENDNRAKD